MKHGIAGLSIIPLRKENSHKSEMVSQLLFGETYKVIETSGTWLRILCSYDEYEGWMDGSQHRGLDEKSYHSISEMLCGITLELSCNVSSNHNSFPVTTGSSLPFFDGLNFRIEKEKFVYNGQSVLGNAKSISLLEKAAMRYLGSPYLWGGRSPFGIDCSGFTQVVYKFLGIKLKRDAYQQAEQGTVVNFVEETAPGDLAFFSNETGKIIHVGIILKDQSIIHSSGYVRIDKLDHFGINNSALKKYTHQLKIIKRFF